MVILNTYILIYEGFAQFEVVLAGYFLKTRGSIVTIGINDNSVTSGEGFITLPHTTLDQVNYKNIDLFIIPGGDLKVLTGNKKLYTLLNKLANADKKIAAICSGPLHLAKCGILDNKKFTTTLSLKEHECFNSNNFQNKNVVVDGNIITAKANGYVDFALELGTVMNIYENEEDYQETINFFKKFKDS